MQLQRDHLLKALSRLGERVQWQQAIEILLIGGAAGMITGQLAPDRTTLDCDVIDYAPPEAMQAVESDAREIADEMGLPGDWLSSQARQLNILPDVWRARRQQDDTFCKLRVYAVGRLDLLATKCYANRQEDREDILAIPPSASKLDFVHTYLTMLRVPSRHANLDQIEAALRLIAALKEGRDRA